MKILDLFKKKKTNSTFPENELEIALMNAAEKISSRKNFYMKLLWSDLYTLTYKDFIKEEGIEEGLIEFKKGTPVQFVTLENGEIPIFTSKNRIFDNGIVKDEVPYFTFKGKDLFSFTKGANFILNPFSDFGKDINSKEIENLMNGSIFDESRIKEIKKDINISIGPPKIYPTKLVNALNEYFEKNKKINVAYLASVIYSKDDKPHLLVGIDGEGDLQSLTNQAVPISEKFKDSSEIVDFVKIEQNDGISDYLINETKPFYNNKNNG